MTSRCQTFSTLEYKKSSVTTDRLKKHTVLQYSYGQDLGLEEKLWSPAKFSFDLKNNILEDIVILLYSMLCISQNTSEHV